MSKKEARKELLMFRKTMVQIVTILWLFSSSFIVFMVMAHQFFPEYMIILAIGLTGVLTLAGSYFIAKIERTMKYMWSKA